VPFGGTRSAFSRIYCLFAARRLTPHATASYRLPPALRLAVIHYVNLNTSVHGVNLIYSTPSLYTDAKLA
jgi:hypothetical protein